MTGKRKRRGTDGEATHEAVDDSPHAALERVLSFAEARGEEYDGATEDHAIVRAAIADGSLVGDKRIPDPAT
jgi:hypothetical protein